MDVTAGHRVSARGGAVRAAIGLIAAIITLLATGGAASAHVAQRVGGDSFAACGLTTAGSLDCWGDSSFGEASPPSGSNFTQLSDGNGDTCALRTDGSIDCWGFDFSGQTDTPSDSDFAQVSAGNLKSCGLHADGSISCWGYSGDGVTTSIPAETDFQQISVGGAHACALRTDGSIDCWGDDTYGQADAPAGTGFTEVSAGDNHSCALTTAGALTCWGDDTYHQTEAPAGTGFRQVVAAWANTCALRADGSITCWGDDSNGEGDAPAGTGFDQIAASPDSYSWCAARTNGTLACWGSNTNGQLSGANASTDTFLPLHASGFLDATNQFTIDADPDTGHGYLTVHDATHHYAGQIRCVRVAGSDVSVVAPFDGTQIPVNQDAGVVFWLHDGTGTGGDVDGQRNTQLSAAALARKYATCPDAAAPPHGTFRPLASGSITLGPFS